MKHDCVVIADIHHGMLKGISGLLESMFHNVVMVDSKESLFETTRKLNPDLIVLDLSLPTDGETSITKECISCFPENKLLVMSVYDEQDIANDIIKSGVSGFVLKRTAATDLIPAIEAILNGNTYISPSIMGNSKLSYEKNNTTETEKNKGQAS